MTYLGDTGQGSTIVFSGDDGLMCVGCPRTIQLPEMTMDGIDTTCLDSTGFMRRIPADISDPGTLEVTFVFDAAKDGVTELFTTGMVIDITVTLPKSRPAGAAIPTVTAAIFNATGFVTSLGLPSLETSTLMELTVSFQLDGDTGPTLTIETPPVACP